MKSGLLVALLTSVLASAAGAATITMAPAPAQNNSQAKTQPQPKVITAPAMAKPSPDAQVKADCPCPQKARRDARAHRVLHRYARSGYYHYAAAAPVRWHGWHGQGRAAPHDASIPGPMAAPGYEVEGLRIEDRGWTGGVGSAPDGGGGFVDGYGQVHFANGGGAENGPTYNSYGQSFQFNPSQAGPFQPRLMGGFAPPSTGSR